MQDPVYFGCMLLDQGLTMTLVSGVTCSYPETIR